MADELSHLGGVLSQQLRSKEPGFAERRATINTPRLGKAADSSSHNFTWRGGHDSLGGASQHVLLVSWLGTHARRGSVSSCYLAHTALRSY